MHYNVKLNYRDSGDGKVSTRVDTEQVSKIAKGMKRRTGNDTGGRNNFSCHVTTRQKFGMIKIKEKKQWKRHVVHVKKYPQFYFCICQNTNNQYQNARHTFLDQKHM